MRGGQRIIPILIGCLLLAALAAATVRGAAGSGGEVELAVAENGVLREEATVSGVFLYAETVVTAEYTGEFNATAEANSRVAAGAQVGTVTLAVTDLVTDNRTEPLYAPVGGLISYTFDGLEPVFNAGAELDWVGVEQRLAHYEATARQSGTVYRGEELYKLIDDRAPLRYFTALDADALPAVPAVGDELTLTFGDFRTAAVAEVALVRSGRLYLVVRLAETRASLYESRLWDARLSAGETRGVTVACGALTDRDGQSGVWVNRGGVAAFQPVTVLRAGEEQAVVTGVSAGELYVLDSKNCRAGEKLAGIA